MAIDEVVITASKPSAVGSVLSFLGGATPFLGSSIDLYEGIKEGNTWKIVLGAGGLILDGVTLGSASVIKGVVKRGAVEIAEYAAKEAVEAAVRNSVEKKIVKVAAKTGIEATNGIKITGFTSHGVDRAIGSFGRSGVKPNAKLDAIKNPLKINNVVTDQLGRQSQIFIGQFGEVVVNPQTGKIISVNSTSSSKAAKLLKQLGQ